MKNLLLNNLPMKIAALVGAVLLWLFVTNISDPVTYVRFSNVPVELQNTDIIEDSGQVYTILDDSDVISSVTVTGPRSVIDTLSDSNIRAVADIRNMTSLGTVEIALSVNKYSEKIDSIKGSTDTVLLSVENRQTKSFTLHLATTGEPADGYVLGDVSLDQNQVRITGPESVVSSVAGARTTVDISGAASTIYTSEDIELYDAEGNSVDPSNVRLNISSVRVTVQILATRELGITASVSGKPAEGYLRAGDVEIEPATVLLAGKSSAVNRQDYVEIPDGVIDLTDVSSDVVRTVDITDYLPEGTTIADSSFDGKVTVTVHVEPVVFNTLDITPDQIEISGVPDGYDAYLVSASGDRLTAANYVGSITISGLGNDVSGVRSSMLSCVAALDSSILDGEGNVMEGIYPETVSVILPAGASLVETPSVYVRLEKTDNQE